MVWKKRFDDLVENLATTVFVIMFSITALQIILRYIFGRPLMWTEEAARFLYVWLTFLGAAVIMRDNEHLTIDFLYQKFPPKVQVFTALLIRMGIIVYCSFVFFGALIMIRINWNAPSPTMPKLITIGHVYLALPVGMALMILYVLPSIPPLVRALFTRESSKEGMGQ